MQTYSIPTLPSMLPGAQDPAQRRHTFTLHTPRFANLAALRQNIKTRLSAWKLADAYIDMAQLSVCEAVTNLIKHPDIKPDTVHITIAADHHIVIDIADNGSPFASFDAKCNTARQCQKACDSLFEGGYGLSFILAQHSEVSYRPASDSPDGFNHFILRDQLPGQQAHHQTAPISATPPQLQAAPAATRARIFIIDDDSNTDALYRPALSRHYDISFFRHAEVALSRFTIERPVLIISDITMPGMDGITLRRHLSAFEGGDTTPFVFLSNTVTSAQEATLAQAGIDDCLCKPVSPERLLSVAARLISRAQSFTAALQGRISTQITAMLHPQLPEQHQSWRIATRSAVAEAGGGDFTVYRSQPAFFMATLADVMGHGLHAKFFAYAYAGYLRSLIQMTGDSMCPANFLGRISAAVNADSFLDNTIMTCMAFSLGENNTITLASAGHPPPWHISHTAQAQPVDIAGPLPGLLGQSRYTQKTLHLLPRERLVLATDGFWDCWDNEHTQATDLRAQSEKSLDEYTDFLWRTAYERAQARQTHKDDATLIIVEAGDMP